MSEPRRDRRHRKERRRRFAAFAALIALVAASPFVLDELEVEVGPLEAMRSRIVGDPRATLSQPPGSDSGGAEAEGGRSADGDAGGDAGDDERHRSGDSEHRSGGSSPAAAAYGAVAPALPGVEPESVGGTFQSTDDPSWAVTRIEAPARDGSYAVYTERGEEGWEARRSLLANNPDYPRKAEALLVGLPQDLQDALYPESTAAPAESPEAAARELASESPYLGESWRPVSLRAGDGFAEVRLEDEESDAYTHAYLRRSDGSWSVAGLGRGLTAAELPEFPRSLVEPGSLPDAGPAMIPTAEPVLEDIPRDRREELEEGLGEVRETVEGYGGTAGLYVSNPGEDRGYGIRPDERFYAASVIKLPVMAAVYRRVESGELSLSDTVATRDRDYAGGAGSLQWQEESVSRTVESYLWAMITESDNVATNVLVRAVGGPEYVNEVARDLGAEDTELRHKVTNQRAAAPGLDNYTTPRDMATILEAIAEGEAANPAHTEEMMSLLRENGSESWLGDGLPAEAEIASKVGWLDGIYNEVALVRDGEDAYVISVFSKYGPPQVGKGSATLAEISREIWEIHNGGEEPEE